MSGVNAGAHRPELDDMTPAQIRALCEELLYTMDWEQQYKIASKLPGLYKMIFGKLPASIVEDRAVQIANEINAPFQNEETPDRKIITTRRCLEVLQNLGF